MAGSHEESEERHLLRDKKDAWSNETIKFLEQELQRCRNRAPAKKTLLDRAAVLVVTAFEGQDYWQKFADLHLGTIFAAYSWRDHKTGECDFTPGAVFCHLSKMYCSSESSPDISSCNTVVVCFATVFAVGHALPKVRERVEMHIQCNNNEIVRRLELIKKDGDFDAGWVRITGAVDAFMSGLHSASDTLKKIDLYYREMDTVWL